MGCSVAKSKKQTVFIYQMTLGDLIQISVMILSIAVAIAFATKEMKDSLNKQTETLNTQTQTLNAQILMLFPKLPIVEWHEGEVHPFDGGSSSVKIVAIDPPRKEVTVQFNVKGTSTDEILGMGQIRTISVPGGGTYRFMLKDIGIRDGHKTAEFVVTEAKE